MEWCYYQTDIGHLEYWKDYVVDMHISNKKKQKLDQITKSVMLEKSLHSVASSAGIMYWYIKSCNTWNIDCDLWLAVW